MAFTSAGGREYYSNVRKLTSGITNCTSGMVKGIWKPDGNTLTFHFQSGDTVQVTPNTGGQIFPFSPRGVTFTSGDCYALF